MTRRIDWRDGATKEDLRKVASWERETKACRAGLAVASYNRKIVIARCYAKAARAAKRGK